MKKTDFKLEQVQKKSVKMLRGVKSLFFLEVHLFGLENEDCKEGLVDCPLNMPGGEQTAEKSYLS